MNIADTVARVTAPLRRAVANMISRAVVRSVDESPKLRTALVSLFAGELANGCELFQQYGIESRPHAGAEAVVVFPGGDRSHGIVIAVADRRYKLTLAEGEVALHDDLGQRVQLARTGIEIETPLDAAIEVGGHLRIAADTIETYARTWNSVDVGGYADKLEALGGSSWQRETWHDDAVFDPTVEHPIQPPEVIE